MFPWASSSAAAVPVKDDGQQESCFSLTGDSFFGPHLRKLPPYQPILPFEVLSSCLGRKPEEIVKLDANENPYGPPPEVFEALSSMRFPYIYPDLESRRLRAALAEDSGVEADYILAGCGADELIDLIMRCVLEPGDKFVDCPPTFTMSCFHEIVDPSDVIKVPRKPDFSLDVKRIFEVVEQEKPKCIFLTSPNNPDGSIIDDETLRKILTLPLLVVLDETYTEFAGFESKMSWVKKNDNLIVLRIFCKRAALAGFRVGYGAFPLSIIKALENPVYLENLKVALVQELERAERLFELLKVPFHSDFILSDFTFGRDAKKLKREGKDDDVESGMEKVLRDENLLSLIFSRLPVESKGRCLAVCKMWGTNLESEVAKIREHRMQPDIREKYSVKIKEVRRRGYWLAKRMCPSESLWVVIQNRMKEVGKSFRWDAHKFMDARERMDPEYWTKEEILKVCAEQYWTPQTC